MIEKSTIGFLAFVFVIIVIIYFVADVKNRNDDDKLVFRISCIALVILVTPKSENDVRLRTTLGNQNPTGLPVGAVRMSIAMVCCEMIRHKGGLF